MSIKSNLALVAVLTSLAAPAFAADQQASEAAADRYVQTQTNIPSGARASVERNTRANWTVQPAAQGDFQSQGSH
jgi:hypothetical protein